MTPERRNRVVLPELRGVSSESDPMTQFHFDPGTYLAMIRGDVGRYDELQDETVRASEGVKASRILELGTGTGETAKRVLALHREAAFIGIDRSEAMLAIARDTLPKADLRVQRLEESLPDGSFELVFSALAVHHLDASEKRDLFDRVAAALVQGGRFVLADVIIPTDPASAQIPLSPDFDRPDRLDDQLAWLAAAGFSAHTTWLADDLAVIAADLRTA